MCFVKGFEIYLVGEFCLQMKSYFKNLKVYKISKSGTTLVKAGSGSLECHLLWGAFLAAQGTVGKPLLHTIINRV